MARRFSAGRGNIVRNPDGSTSVGGIRQAPSFGGDRPSRFNFGNFDRRQPQPVRQAPPAEIEQIMQMLPSLPPEVIKQVIPTLPPEVIQQVIPTLPPEIAQQVIPSLPPQIAQQFQQGIPGPMDPSGTFQMGFNNMVPDAQTLEQLQQPVPPMAPPAQQSPFIQDLNNQVVGGSNDPLSPNYKDPRQIPSLGPIQSPPPGFTPQVPLGPGDPDYIDMGSFLGGSRFRPGITDAPSRRGEFESIAAQDPNAIPPEFRTPPPEPPMDIAPPMDRPMPMPEPPMDIGRPPVFREEPIEDQRGGMRPPMPPPLGFGQDGGSESEPRDIAPPMAPPRNIAPPRDISPPREELIVPPIATPVEIPRDIAPPVAPPRRIAPPSFEREPREVPREVPREIPRQEPREIPRQMPREEPIQAPVPPAQIEQIKQVLPQLPPEQLIEILPQLPPEVIQELPEELIRQIMPMMPEPLQPRMPMPAPIAMPVPSPMPRQEPMPMPMPEQRSAPAPRLQRPSLPMMPMMGGRGRR